MMSKSVIITDNNIRTSTSFNTKLFSGQCHHVALLSLDMVDNTYVLIASSCQTLLIHKLTKFKLKYALLRAIRFALHFLTLAFVSGLNLLYFAFILNINLKYFYINNKLHLMI